MNRHLPEQLLHQLARVTGEITEDLTSKAWKVTRNVESDEAFQQGARTERTMIRDIVLHAAKTGAGEARLNVVPTIGGGLDLVFYDDDAEYRFRVKIATYGADGHLDLVCGANSTLITPIADPGLLPVHQWLLIVDVDDAAPSVQVATITSYTSRGSGPVHLVLGPTTPIDPTTQPDGFDPGDDDDLGDGFERRDAGGLGDIAGSA